VVLAVPATISALPQASKAALAVGEVPMEKVPSRLCVLMSQTSTLCSPAAGRARVTTAMLGFLGLMAMSEALLT
jgi:hypothetical protein